MNDLKSQLTQAGIAYRACRYPGDLAGEVLPVRTGHRPPRLRLALAGIMSLAAAVAVALVIRNAKPQTSAVSSQASPREATLARHTDPIGFSLPAMPAFPGDGQAGPAYQALTLPGMPGFFPNSEAGPQEQRRASTQEAV